MTRTRKITLAAVAVLLIAVVIFVSGGWYLSNLIRDGGLLPDREEQVFDLEVAAIGDGKVTLRVTSETEEEGDWQHDGIFGLVGSPGYNQVGPIIEVSDQHVVREFLPMSNDTKVGDMVRLESYGFPEDPQRAHGIPFEEVSFSSELGDFTAWYVDGSSDTWVILVHGRSAHREEALRILPTIVELGLPSLIINYRNDLGLPTNSDGFHQYGLTEWEEVEGAVRYAIEHGANEIVLAGYTQTANGDACLVCAVHEPLDFAL